MTFSRPRQKSLLLTAIFLSHLLGFQANASSSSLGEKKLLYPSSTILEVEKNSFTIHDIMNDGTPRKFIPTKDQLIEMRSQKFGYWVKFQFDADQYQDPYLLVPHYGTDRIDFYQVEGKKVIQHLKSGVNVKQSDQSIKNTNSIFKINKEKGGTIHGYFYIEGNNVPNFPFYVMSSTSLIESSYADDMFGGIILGLMLLIFIYNIGLYIQIRESDNLYYSLWVLGWMGTLLIYKGYGARFLWSEMTILNDYVDVWFLPTNLAFILFTFKFLKLKSTLKKFHRFGIILIGMYCVMTGFTIAGKADSFYNAFNIGNIVLLQGIWATMAGIKSYRKGFKPALIFTIANLFLFITIGIFFAVAFGHLAHSFVTHNIMHLGGGLQIIFFSLALSYKINLFKTGKETAEKEQLQLLKTNQELIEKQKEKLELQVEERTKELVQEKREVEIQKERAEQSEAFKQQFLANMSHEIRTPMNAVMGMTNLVLDTPLDTKQKSYLEKVKKSSENLLYIINDILDLAKIEAGKMELETIDFSMADTVDQVKQTLQHRAEEKGLSMLTNIQSSVEDVLLGDPVRLNQILINLTGNAIKFTEKGSVSIGVERYESKVRFTVTDTGIGIPTDKIQTVFESFSQANTSDTRKYGGTGLGLSISQQLVSLMGSTIQIESELGRGTRFYFDVDFEIGNSERLDQRLASEKNVDGSILDGLTILIADDNEYNRIVAADTLRSKANVAILEAGNGREVIELLDEKVDIVLMDAQMPVMNGFEATQYIRTQMKENLCNVPIIALTASVLRTDLDKCIAAGMIGYISKPFRAQELIVGIANALNISLKRTLPSINNPKSSSATKKNVTNLTYLQEFCEGDSSKMDRYVGMFLKSAPSFLAELKALIKVNDTEGLANQVHGFNTKLVMMGMKEEKGLSVEIENALREGASTEDIAEKIEEIKTKVEKAIVELS
jgi:signal transduction histidine kinase/DNA-binding NarL/FixJ family response regulator